MDNRSIQTPGGRSLGGGYWGDTDSRDVEDLTLKVHGISPVGMLNKCIINKFINTNLI